MFRQVAYCSFKTKFQKFKYLYSKHCNGLYVYLFGFHMARFNCEPVSDQGLHVSNLYILQNALKT